MQTKLEIHTQTYTHLHNQPHPTQWMNETDWLTDWLRDWVTESGMTDSIKQSRMIWFWYRLSLLAHKLQSKTVWNEKKNLNIPLEIIANINSALNTVFFCWRPGIVGKKYPLKHFLRLLHHFVWIMISFLMVLKRKSLKNKINLSWLVSCLEVKKKTEINEKNKKLNKMSNVTFVLPFSLRLKLYLFSIYFHLLSCKCMFCSIPQLCFVNKWL